jgi:glycosyltransferase XagB
MQIPTLLIALIALIFPTFNTAAVLSEYPAKPVEIVRGEAPSAAVVLSIDTSDSMYGRPLQEARRAARAFVERIDEGIPVSIVTFDSEVRIVQHYTTDKSELIATIESLTTGGLTALYDGTLTAVNLAASVPASNRVVIMLSDGAEYGGQSQAARADALEAARTQDVAVFTIGLGFGADRSYLEELAAATNAINYEAPTTNELLTIYETLSDRFISSAEPNGFAPAQFVSYPPVNLIDTDPVFDNPQLVDHVASVPSWIALDDQAASDTPVTLSAAVDTTPSFAHLTDSNSTVDVPFLANYPANIPDVNSSAVVDSVPTFSLTDSSYTFPALADAVNHRPVLAALNAAPALPDIVTLADQTAAKPNLWSAAGNSAESEDDPAPPAGTVLANRSNAIVNIAFTGTTRSTVPPQLDAVQIDDREAAAVTARLANTTSVTLDLAAINAAAVPSLPLLGNHVTSPGVPTLASLITFPDPVAIVAPAAVQPGLRLVQGAPTVPSLTSRLTQQPIADMTSTAVTGTTTAIVLAIDTSDSMSGGALQQAQEAARSFIERVNGDTQVAIVAFGSEVEVVQPYTTNSDILLRAIDSLRPGGVTALYDGTLTAINLAANSPAANRVVILLSDGGEFGGQSQANRDDALTAASEQNVAVYTIGLGFGADRTYLEELAIATNAQSYEAPSAAQLAEIYTTLGDHVLASSTPSERPQPQLSDSTNTVNIPPLSALAVERSQRIDDLTASLNHTPIQGMEGLERSALGNNALVTNIPPLRDEIATLGIDPAQPGLPSVIMPSERTSETLASLLPQLNDGSLENLPSILTSNVVPVMIDVPRNSDIATAELTLNGYRLATFTEGGPFTYDLDTNMLSSGEYNLMFTVINSRNVISAGEINFQIVEINRLPLLGGTEGTQAEVAEIDEISSSLGALPAESSAETAATTESAGLADEFWASGLAPRILLVDGEIQQPLHLSFSMSDGLIPVAPRSLMLGTSDNLMDILARPASLIPEPIRAALATPNPELWTVVIFIMSISLLPQGLFTLYWMMYTWNNPDAAEKYQSPKEYLPPQHSFTALLPARQEEDVIKDTIKAVDRIDYPDHLKEILVLIRDEDDDATIAKAHEAIAEIGKDNIKVVTFTDGPKNKPNGLNRGLKVASNDVVCIFDAEDEPHSEIYNVINTVMVRDGADVVQSGVQLMNFKSTWFSALNCLEYFFWFKSGLHAFTRKFNVTPLGGNTVFFKREWMERIGGWDENCLTEDADVGIRLTLEGAKIQIVYDEKHATQEETPHDAESFIKQRTRWCQGFYEIFFKGDWLKLPEFRQKLAAIYILLNSLLQAAMIFYLPVGIYVALTQQISVPVALFSYLPIFLLLTQMFINLTGIREFTQAYGMRLPFMFRFKMILFYYPYQLMLAVSAMRAVQRFITRENAWEKTAHSNLHRPQLATENA